MRRALVLLALLPLPALAEPVAATDLLGREVALDRPAERVVAGNITALGQMLALGLEPAATFCAPEERRPAAYLRRQRNMVVPADTPCISNLDWSIDWEAVAATDADLFVGWDEEEAAVAAAILPFFGTATYETTGQGDSLETYEASLRGIARLTGREAEAEAALDATRARIEAYANRAAERAPEPVTALHVGTQDRRGFFVFAQGSLNCRLLDRIADCVAPGAPDDFYVEGTSEMILAVDPEVILLLDYAGGGVGSGEDADAFLEALSADPLWGELRAVRAGRVHLLPHDARASSVWGVSDYLDTVAPLLYPDIFPAPLTDAEVAAALGRSAP